MDIEQIFEQALGEPAVERERKLDRIKELIPENYRLDDANTAEAGVVMEIYELLHGVELQDPDDELVLQLEPVLASHLVIPKETTFQSMPIMPPFIPFTED